MEKLVWAHSMNAQSVRWKGHVGKSNCGGRNVKQLVTLWPQPGSRVGSTSPFPQPHEMELPMIKMVFLSSVKSGGTITDTLGHSKS